MKPTINNPIILVTGADGELINMLCLLLTKLNLAHGIAIGRHYLNYVSGQFFPMGSLKNNAVIKLDQLEAFIQRYESKTPLGRMAKEDDFRGVIAYLASDMSKYVTGQNLSVDGGLGDMADIFYQDRVLNQLRSLKKVVLSANRKIIATIQPNQNHERC